MQAIVLDRRDFREYDQIVSLFTKEEGKREALARGIKKSLAKQSSFLEPCSFIEAEIIQGKQRDHLIRSQPIDLFSALRRDVVRAFSAAYIAGVTDRLIRPHAPDSRVFALLLSSLRFLSSVEHLASLFFDSYLLKLGSLLGYEPELERCLLCGKFFKDMIVSDWSGEGSPRFSCRKGGALCQRCVQEGGEQVFDTFPLSLKEASSLSLLLKSNWSVIHAYAVSSAEQEHLHTIILQFVRYHSEVRVPDWRPTYTSFVSL